MSSKKGARKRTPQRLATHLDFVPNGDGTFRAVPQRPAVYAPIAQAARSTGLTKDTVYRLFKSGLIRGDQPSPRKIRIDMASLQTHRRNSAQDDFWTEEKRRRFAASEGIGGTRERGARRVPRERAG